MEFIQGKLNKITDAVSKLKNEGLYVEHTDEKPSKEKVSQEDRIEEVLDIATTLQTSRVFNMNKAISIKELLHSQKRDKFCRKLAKSLHKQNNFKINHERLLVKQVCILRTTY